MPEQLVVENIELGTIKGSATDGGEIFTYQDIISDEDQAKDIYFTLDSDSYTFFNLKDSNYDLDLEIYRDNPDGQDDDLLITSDNSGVEAESIFKYLTAGNYTAFIYPYIEESYPVDGASYTLEIDTQTFLEIALLPDDPLFGNQWHLFNTGQGTGSDNTDIGAPEGWAIQSASPEIIVAVIDGGVDLSHPDLIESIWVNSDEIEDNGLDDDGNGYIDDINGWNFYFDTHIINVNSDGDDHGTHVAGTIGASGNNGIGVTGVTWDTQIMPLTVFEAYAEGAGDITSAIYYAVDNGANVINMSLGLDYEGSIDDYIAEFPDDHQLYLDALTYAVNKGTTVVIAAGNDNNSFDSNWISSPAYFSELIPGVISVAASGNTAEKAGYSNYGSTVTITAPGGDFFSSGDGVVEDGLYATYPLQPQETQTILFENGYGYMHGTSMAAPVVTGSIALLLQKHPDLTPAQVEEALVQSAPKSKSLEGISQEGSYLDLYSLLSYFQTDGDSSGDSNNGNSSSGSNDNSTDSGDNGSSTGGNSSGGSSGGGASSGGSSGSPSTPAIPVATTPPVASNPEQTQPVPEVPISPITVSPVPTIQSPVLGIQPQEVVTTVQLVTPISVGNLQFAQAVVGTTMRDVITGSDQGEVLAGGGGKNQTTGGGGPDAFLFETPGEFGKQNADVVTDFSPEDGDVLAVSQEAFSGLNRIKFTSVSGKRQAKQAGRTNKNFIYDERKGMLYYDGNGKKNGWGDGGEFVQLLGSPEIGKPDIAIV